MVINNKKMKIIIIVLTTLIIGINIQAQTQTDTIFRMNGEIILATVTGIDEGSIQYCYPYESFSNSINKSFVYKIHFISGRIEEFSSTRNVSNVKSCLDWEEVQLSSIPSEVESMYKIDDVSAKSQGNSTMSSLGKMQSRTLNKVKMQTAMLGGNTCYISHQNTESAAYGKTPSVVISAMSYTSKKVFKREIVFGKYKSSDICVLKTNKYNIEKIHHKSISYQISEDMIYMENGFPRIKITFKYVPMEIEKYTIIYASDTVIILSGIYTSRKSKTTFYNVFLEKE